MRHSVRKLAPVTGSSMHNAIGLRSLKEMKSQFDENILGLDVQPKSELVQKYLDHGTKMSRMLLRQQLEDTCHFSIRS